ncbi:Fe(3+) ABC transporter substrate-binding protein [Arcobacter arenosus]|uniref:Fe(3+) ABC transporter substrate-binding protein n=1 Tax=Arcobacter arenosus TaxID=2576037 RepID=A0A5R8Y0S7_9BACT|nr:Fe(3+) ABC transporter substrate-binding protein [Arcobacter arenosus]TLP38368.1 Fe(3+) ABC transporter substrate-binding protein [Arcobacter arenosus]
MIKQIILSFFIFTSFVFASSEVNVYSHRHYDTDKQLYKMFEEKMGIKVNVVNADANALIKRLESEGEKSPADVLITVDAGRLYQAKSKELIQSIESKYLMEVVPENMRDEDNKWFALTKRVRAFIVPIDSNIEIKTYEDLIKPEYKKMIMVRSSNHVYNQSMLAAVIAHHGEEYALKWAQGVVKNMARKPRGNDRYQVKAVANGIGKIAIANTYYVGKMIGNKDIAESEAVKKVKIIFPKFENGGTHINVSGAGVAKYAPNKENAIKFIEFLLSPEAQDLFANGNFEYPVAKGVKKNDVVSSWGTFEEDNISINTMGKYNINAVKIFDKAGWK